jgi:hypothetical protein
VHLRIAERGATDCDNLWSKVAHRANITTTHRASLPAAVGTIGTVGAHDEADLQASGAGDAALFKIVGKKRAAEAQ